jgi:hypothetical protein
MRINCAIQSMISMTLKGEFSSKNKELWLAFAESRIAEAEAPLTAFKTYI